MKIHQKLPEDKNIDFENPQKHGFGKRIMFLSNNLDKLDFLKTEDHTNKIEGSLLVTQILGIFVPLETQKLIKTNQNNIKYNENSQEVFAPTEEINYKGTLKSKYQIFLILQKNERLEIISDNLRIAEGLIKALTELLNNKKMFKIKNKLQCFFIVENI